MPSCCLDAMSLTAIDNLSLFEMCIDLPRMGLEQNYCFASICRNSNRMVNSHQSWTDHMVVCL